MTMQLILGERRGILLPRIVYHYTVERCPECGFEHKNPKDAVAAIFSRPLGEYITLSNVEAQMWTYPHKPTRARLIESKTLVPTMLYEGLCTVCERPLPETAEECKNLYWEVVGEPRVFYALRLEKQDEA